MGRRLSETVGRRSADPPPRRRPPTRRSGRIPFAVTALLCAAGLLTAAALSCGTFSDGTGEHRLTILHFSDLHGHLAPFKRVSTSADNGVPAALGMAVAPPVETRVTRVDESAGFARLAGIADRIRAENRRQGVPTLLLVAGDVLQGTPLSVAFRGEAEILALNRIHPDAMVLGNHEFDYGVERLEQLMEMAEFPVISANVFRKRGGNPFTKPYVILNLGTFYAGIVGITAPDTPLMTTPDNVAGLEFRPVRSTIWKPMSELRPVTDIIIGLTHLGLDLDRETAESLARLSVVVGGHDHLATAEPVLASGGRPIVHSGSDGLYLGRLDLVFFKPGSRGAPKIISAEHRLIPIDDSLPVDVEVEALIDGYREKADAAFAETLGTLNSVLVGERPSVQSGDTGLGNLVTDLMRQAAGADMALLNAGAIRASLPAGPVTMADLVTALPFENRLVRLELSGTEIEAVLNRSAAIRQGDGIRGGFLQVSGLSFTIRGAAATDIRVGGEPLEPERTYRVAVNDFLAQGGDGYTGLAAARTGRVETRHVIQDLLAEHLRRHGPVDPPVGGRIRIEE